MPSFPDESRYPRSADGSEPILGGSIGLNRVLIRLREDATSPNRIAWGAVLLSAFTIFRNIYLKDSKPEELTARFRLDVDLFRLYFDAYLTAQHMPNHTVPVVIYVPHYDYLPKEVVRIPGPVDMAMFAAFDRFIRSFPNSEVNYGTNAATTLWVVTVGARTMLPHIGLAHWLQNQALILPHFGYRYNLPILLLSHCPIDLHISRRLPRVYLLESYQGTIRSSKEFGRKLSTSNEAIPFTMATHRAFGDPVHLIPLANLAQRKILLDTIISKRWIARPAEAVLLDTAKIIGVSVADLTKLRL